MLIHACGQIAEEIFISSHLHEFTWALLTRSALSLGCDGNPQPQTDVLTAFSKSDHLPKVKTSLLFQKENCHELTRIFTNEAGSTRVPVHINNQPPRNRLTGY
jgi:hypothetical protein